MIDDFFFQSKAVKSHFAWGVIFLRCDGHVTNLTGESPVVGSYRQA